MNNNFTRAHNAHLTPPDEPEAVMCEHCGEEMIAKYDGMKCFNDFCPSKFDEDSTERAMAIELVEAFEEIESLKAKVKRLEMKWIS
jgi:hypothetical protein